MGERVRLLHQLVALDRHSRPHLERRRGLRSAIQPRNLGTFGSGTVQFSGNETQAAHVSGAFTFDLSGGNYTIAPTNGNAGDYPLNIAQSSALTVTGAGTLTTPIVSFGGSLLIQNKATVHVTGQIPASAATSSIVTTFDPGVTTSVSV